jgi:hypothetical protein
LEGGRLLFGEFPERLTALIVIQQVNQQFCFQLAFQNHLPNIANRPFFGAAVVALPELHASSQPVRRALAFGDTRGAIKKWLDLRGVTSMVGTNPAHAFTTSLART